MPWHLSCHNHKLDSTWLSTPTFGPSSYIKRRGPTYSTDTSSWYPWPGVVLPLASMTGQGRDTPNGELSKCHTKNTKPRNAYDVEQYSKDFENSNTIMQKYSDPLSVMCHIRGFLTDIYEDARLQNLTVGNPNQAICRESMRKFSRNWTIWLMPDGVMPTLADIQYPSAVR